MARRYRRGESAWRKASALIMKAMPASQSMHFDREIVTEAAF